MHAATWVFYAVVTFFLGLLSVASGAAIMLGKVITPDQPDAEPLAKLLTVLTLAVTALFVLGSVNAAYVAAMGRGARIDEKEAAPS
jgi:hypothetical protein